MIPQDRFCQSALLDKILTRPEFWGVEWYQRTLRYALPQDGFLKVARRAYAWIYLHGGTRSRTVQIRK